MRYFNSNNLGFRSGPLVVVFIAAAVLGVIAPPASGQVHVWSLGFGGVDSDYSFSVAADAAGNVFATGRFQGTVDFGNGPHTSQGISDIFLVKYDAAGNCLWSKTFGNSTYDGGWGVDTDLAGNVYLTGIFERTVDFGGGGLTSAGWDTYDIFLAKYDADGNHLWSYRYGDAYDDIATDISVNDAGDVAITGYFLGDLDFGGGTISATLWDDCFLAIFDAGGSHQWSSGFGGADVVRGFGVHIDDTGNVVMTGSFEGTAWFGGGGLTASGEGGHPDIFLAKYNAAGAHQWSQRFGWVLPDEGADVSVDNAGNVAVTGYFDTQAYFGGPAWIFGTGYKDIFIATFDAGGTYLWAQAFGNTGADMGHDVDFDDAGNVIATGSFSVSADFGGGTLTSAGYTDIFLASYDATGSHLWSRRYGGATYDYGQGVCTGGPGELWLTGSFGQTIDFGGGPLTGAGPPDVFVVRFGVPQPAAGVIAVTDVPDDQGGWVTIDFVRSEHDDLSDPLPIVSYEVWRKEPFPNAPLLVGTVAATQQDIYSIDVRTREDNILKSFRVSAKTTIPSYYNAPWAYGVSVDNLAPAAPQNFVPIPPHLLTWDPAPEPDFDYFTLYGSSSATLDGSAVMIATTTNTSYDVQAHSYKYYHLTATDDAGNEGEAATTSRPIGVGDVATPGALDLRVHPNPFNPTTTITYVVPQAGRVTVSVYDVTGKLIDTLVDNAYREAEQYRIEYRPSAATGVYFVRVSAGGEAKTTRIVLLK